LDKDKWVKLDGWDDAEVAKQIILDSIKMYQDSL
jgi:inorganic pyrophosphatase